MSKKRKKKSKNKFKNKNKVKDKAKVKVEEESVGTIEPSALGQLHITLKALKKIHSYTRAVDSEIGGLLVIDTSESIPLIEDALLFKQTATSASMELDGGTLARYVTQVAVTNPRKLEKLVGWFHSHGNGSVFWSNTDDECFENFLSTSELAYGIVVNKSGDMLARVDFMTNRGAFSLDDLKLVPKVTSTVKSYVEEAKKKVKVKKWCGYNKNYKQQKRTIGKEWVYCKDGVWRKNSVKHYPSESDFLLSGFGKGGWNYYD